GEEISLDNIAHEKSDDQRGQRRDADAEDPRPAVERGAERRVERSLDRDQAREALVIEHDDREDGPELDGDFERRGLLADEAEQIPDHDQMAGGRDGDELRQPFDDSQYDRDRPVSHGSTLRAARPSIFPSRI